MIEQLTSPKDQKSSSPFLPRWENRDSKSGFVASRHEGDNNVSQQNPELAPRFDFGKMSLFPTSKPLADLPRNLQNKLEAAFGVDFSTVAIHKNSQEASNLDALAFTQGEKMHFAPGEFNPNSEKGKNLIGHEFTHIVQQRNKRVVPTHVLNKNWDLNEDKTLEKEADSLGKKAVQGEPISSYHATGPGVRHSLRTVQPKNNVIQRAVKTWGGEWDTDQYKLRKDKDFTGKTYPAATGVRGVDIKLKFTPNKNVNAQLIGLTQSVQAFVGGAASFTDPTKKGRSIDSKDAKSINTGKGETDEGTAIDQLSEFRNPLYATGKTKNKDTLSSTATSAQWGKHGWRYTNKAGKVKTRAATLKDNPTRSGAAKNSRHIFETTALALKGSQTGTYYGSVRWGWRTDAKENFTKIPLQIVSQGTPSSTFLKAAELWNASKTSKGAETLDLPVEGVKVISNPKGVNIGLGPLYTHLPMGTRVVEMPGFPSMIKTYIRVVDGIYTGETGTVKNSDLKDERN